MEAEKACPLAARTVVGIFMVFFRAFAQLFQTSTPAARSVDRFQPHVLRDSCTSKGGSFLAFIILLSVSRHTFSRFRSSGGLMISSVWSVMVAGLCWAVQSTRRPLCLFLSLSAFNAGVPFGSFAVNFV